MILQIVITLAAILGKKNLSKKEQKLNKIFKFSNKPQGALEGFKKAQIDM